MKLLRIFAVSLIAACVVRSHAQAVSEPKFRTEIQIAENGAPNFVVTNLSDKTLTACTIQFWVSTEGRPQSSMDWDSLVQWRGPSGEPQEPLAPGASMTRYLPHRVGAPLPDRVESVAGIRADGKTFEQTAWIKTLVDNRATLTTAYAQAVSILQDGLSHDWTRSQYLAAINGKPNSGPFLSIRRTLEGPTDWDKNARPLKLAMQDLLTFFTKNLSQLRPPNASQQVTASP